MASIDEEPTEMQESLLAFHASRFHSGHLQQFTRRAKDQ